MNDETSRIDKNSSRDPKTNREFQEFPRHKLRRLNSRVIKENKLSFYQRIITLLFPSQRERKGERETQIHLRANNPMLPLNKHEK